MPRRAQALSLEEAALAAFNEHFDAAAVRAAAQLGRPPQTQPIGDAEKVRQWGVTDGSVDRPHVAQALLTTGLPPERLDPRSPQQLAVLKAAPDLTPLYAQPVQDPELADVLAGLAERPFRYGLLAAIDDPEEQVKEAERLSRLHDRQTSAAYDAAMAARPGAPAEPVAPTTTGAPVLPDQSMTMGG